MTNPIEALARATRSAKVLADAGVLGMFRPDQMIGAARALRRYGLSAGAVYALGAARRGNAVAVVDDDGEETFGQMEELTSTLAAGLVDVGVAGGDRIGLLCRNHRGFILATVALAKIGADVLFLNTGFAGPQLADVCRREDVSTLILDEEFLGLAGGVAAGIRRIVAHGDPGAAAPGGLATIDDLAAGAPRPAPARGREGRQIILTSGTTGPPKGATRDRTASIDPLVALLSRIPLHTGDVTYVAAPMFHAWGLAHVAVGWVLGSTLVLRRRFDPEEALRLIEEEEVTVLAAVPIMLQRIMELPAATRARYDTSSLRVVALSGSALPGDLAIRFMDAFGDVLYNLYGSTEVAWVSIATPADLRAAPGTAGRPTGGTTVKLLDAHGHEVPEGRPGRIFVGNSLLFDGYTDGGGKEIVDGLMATGDTGHFDRDGRLFVDGRDDDMIVSGGENVFPLEVEDQLLHHPAVADVCVVGVPDDEWGQRLRAYVVLRKGESPTGAELQDYVRSHLARFKVPREVVFVDDIPRNATGKIQRSRLEV